MKLFHRNRPESSEPSQIPNSTPAQEAQDKADPLQEVFVYEEEDLFLAQTPSSLLSMTPTSPASEEPLQVEPTPRNYVQNLRLHGGSTAAHHPVDHPVDHPADYPANHPSDTHSASASTHPNQSSQGYPDMASGNYNGKFITIPYSLLPARGQSDTVGQTSAQTAAVDSDPSSSQAVSGIDEAVITAVEQQVRNNIVTAGQAELKQSRQKLQNIAWAIREGDDRRSVLKAAVSKTREALQADRVIFYRCTAPEQGLVEAESLGSGWTPSLDQYLPLLFFGGETLEDYQTDQVYAFTRSQNAEFSPYQQQLMDQYQVKASLALPVVLNDKPWGFLVAHQCGQYRQWHESEIDLIYQVVTEIRLKLQAVEFEHEFQQQVEHGAALVKVIQKIQQAEGVEGIFRTATTEIRRALNCDRAVIYRCNEDWTGRVVAEAVGKGWVSILKEQERDQAFCSDILPDNCSFVNLYPDDEQVITFEKDNALLRETQGGQFNQGVPFRKVDDVYAMGFSDCYIETLEKFQCRAYIHAPIFQDGKFWGILCAYQNSGPRKWSMGEANLMVNLTTPLNTALQQTRTVQQVKAQAEQLLESAQREQLVSSIVSRIRQSLNVEQVFRTTTQEIRRFLKCDRAVVYRFNADWTGEFVAESVGPRLNSILGQGFSAEMGNCHSLTSLRPGGIPTNSRDVRVAQESLSQGRDYTRCGFFLDDVEAHDLAGDFLDAMEMIGARSYVMSGIFVGGKIWGMLAVYHGSPYHWQESDRQLIAQVAEQCGVALQQAEYVEQLKTQTRKLQESAERERSVASLINRIRENQKADAVFRTATQEVRRLLNCDRTIIYRFNEDWSGEVVAESVGAGWMALLQLQAQDSSLKQELMASDDCVVKYYGDRNNEAGSPSNTIKSILRPNNGELFKQDTYLRDTKGGVYTQGERFRQVDDVEAMNFAPCYQRTLEKFQCKAYLNVPIFQGSKLWGLMAAYQNDGPRQWEEADANLLLQIAPQMGLTLQQVEYLEQLERQSLELQASAEREKAANSEMQLKVVNLLRAVRPALEGDLTVRAPVTEDAVGTVADAYNNTIQALRQIVTQVKDVAQRVGSTSEESSVAIAQLSEQSQTEKQAIQQALGEIQSLRSATDAVATNAAKVEAAVQQANQVVKQGDSAMNRTVDGIMAIRSTVSETSKKIKRLSESSQKISRVVSLIGDFTTQTQLLALNAAIEATRAGEYGRGFAVVADEVRSLARQSAEATTEIEKLVQEIQAETSAVTQAMDTGIDQVVSGTTLVNETRASLTEIVAATAKISDFVQGITDSATTQTKQFQSVEATMNSVTQLATQSSENSLEISASVKDLVVTAQDLQSRVGKFKV